MLGRDHQKVSAVEIEDDVFVIGSGHFLADRGYADPAATVEKKKSPDLEGIAEAIEIFEQSRPLTEKT
jgi:hypothetical protein